MDLHSISVNQRYHGITNVDKTMPKQKNSEYGCVIDFKRGLAAAARGGAHQRYPLLWAEVTVLRGTYIL